MYTYSGVDVGQIKADDVGVLDVDQQAKVDVECISTDSQLGLVIRGRCDTSEIDRRHLEGGQDCCKRYYETYDDDNDKPQDPARPNR